MKKILAILLTAILALACACAMAEVPEDVLDRFSDTWVADDCSIEVYFDDEVGAVVCDMALKDDTFADFTNCQYDAAADALVCADGIQYHAIFNSETGDYDKDIVKEGITATLTIADGKLSCADSEALLKDVEFLRLDDAEEADGARLATGLDPWGNPLTVSVDTLIDGKLEWTYMEDFNGQMLIQYSADTELVDGVGPFHVEGTLQDENGEEIEGVTGDYSGTIAVGDEEITLTYAAGQVTESSTEGGSTAYHVEALEEAGRTVTLKVVTDEKIISPEFSGIDTTDATCPVAFEREDLKDGVLNDVHIFTQDYYDIVDISEMAVGDTFEAEGRTIIIETLETNADGDIIINGGMEEEDGYTLISEEDTNGWRTMIWDDFGTYTERDVVNLPLAENVTFNDSWNIDAEPVTATGIEDVTKAIMESENDSFYEHNTELVIEGGKVVAINRHYVP